VGALAGFANVSPEQNDLEAVLDGAGNKKRHRNNIEHDVAVCTDGAATDCRQHAEQEYRAGPAPGAGDDEPPAFRVCYGTRTAP